LKRRKDSAHDSIAAPSSAIEPGARYLGDEAVIAEFSDEARGPRAVFLGFLRICCLAAVEDALRSLLLNP